jgi:hypothetical protein
MTEPGRLPDAPPPELVEAIASGECILCGGGGLASQAGLPTWTAVLEGILHFARDKLDDTTASALATALKKGELEAVADDLTHQVPRELLLNYIQSATSAAKLSQAHRLLGRLPFVGAINVSLDDLLLTAFENRAARLLLPADTDELIAALRSKTFFIANIFGVASQPSSVVLTAKEFRALLATNLRLKQCLTTLFLRYTVFSIGSELDGIRTYLDGLEFPNVPERPHYALVAHEGPLDPVKRRFFERTYNVRVIEYEPQVWHRELDDFLKRLRAAVGKRPRAGTSSRLILKSVTLENIGPFHHLHLDLTQSWNLLLGNNGVGKTVILRAIAAALCGERADPLAATRLLRSGATSGAIRLKIEGRDYTVELKRDSDGNVRIVSASLSPIIYDQWLVLGFPALRSIPWARPKGPSAPGRDAPSEDDLLPILRGEPDTRLADIKQWMVNLDYAGEEKLLTDFFKLLQRFTPDLCLKLHAIDKTTMEISVDTDGGVVPLESVSQGTGSVMSWVGTLLQRLSETGNAAEARQGAALVLIDEIDVHMHPAWQQIIVGVFRKNFKAVQVIATTHSPLLVGSMKSDEIWRVQRAPLKSEIYGVAHLQTGPDGTQEILILGPEDEQRLYRVPTTAELLIKDGDIVEEGEPLTKTPIFMAERGEPIYGSSADQVLQSPYFALDSARPPEVADELRALDQRAQSGDRKAAVEFMQRLAYGSEQRVFRKSP